VLGVPAIDDLTEVASHEIAEAVTDPDVDHGIIGWYDDSADGEVGDLANLQWVALGGFAVQRIADKHGQAMTPAGATSLQPVSFVLRTDGRLFEHSAQGWTLLCGGVASVSDQGIDNDGRAMVDVVLTNGLAYEYHHGFGWTFLQSGVKQACAGQGGSYVLLRSGQLMEYRDGAAARTATLAQNVVAIDAGTDRYGVSSVDVVYSSGNGAMYSDSTGWHTLCAGVQTVSAGERGVSGVLLRDGRAYEYQEAGGTWYFLGRGVAQLTAGFNSNGAAVLDTLSHDGTLIEYHANLASQVVATQVKSVSAARGGVLDIVSMNGSAYEHTATGWTLLCAEAQTAV
jgi:hypothetical protein